MLNLIIRGQVTAQKLEEIYTTIGNIVKNEKCYYTEEQINKLKENKENVFIEKSKKIK